MPHGLQVTKELHHAQHVLNVTDTEHTCDRPGIISHSSEISIKKDLTLCLWHLRGDQPSCQVATDSLPFETVLRTRAFILFL